MHRLSTSSNGVRFAGECACPAQLMLSVAQLELTAAPRYTYN